MLSITLFLGGLAGNVVAVFMLLLFWRNSKCPADMCARQDVSRNVQL